MPQTIRAIVVNPAAPGKLAVKRVELRDPDRDEVGVRVTAISLNRGETRRALQMAEPGWRPGWDFAGVVETAAADGSGPKPGTRVVGILPSGAWAERVNCRSHAVAALPDRQRPHGWSGACAFSSDQPRSGNTGLRVTTTSPVAVSRTRLTVCTYSGEPE